MGPGVLCHLVVFVTKGLSRPTDNIEAPLSRVLSVTTRMRDSQQSPRVSKRLIRP